MISAKALVAAFLIVSLIVPYGAFAAVDAGSGVTTVEPAIGITPSQGYTETRAQVTLPETIPGTAGIMAGAGAAAGSLGAGAGAGVFGGLLSFSMLAQISTMMSAVERMASTVTQLSMMGTNLNKAIDANNKKITELEDRIDFLTETLKGLSGGGTISGGGTSVVSSGKNCYITLPPVKCDCSCKGDLSPNELPDSLDTIPKGEYTYRVTMNYADNIIECSERAGESFWGYACEETADCDEYIAYDNTAAPDYACTTGLTQSGACEGAIDCQCYDDGWKEAACKKYGA